MERAKIRQAREVRGAQQVQAVFEILLVHVNEVRLRRAPHRGHGVRCAEVQVARERAPALIVGVGVVRPQHLAEARESVGQFVHPRIRRGPERDGMAAMRECAAEIDEVKFAAPART